MKTPLSITTRIPMYAAVLLVLAPAVRATDYYVNGLTGNDASNGTTPATAWRTLTHASNTASAGSAHVIHVAPASYSTANGETFPLRFHMQSVISDGGASVTTIDGAGAAVVLLELDSPRGSGSPFGFTQLRGFTLRDATTAVRMTSAWNTLTTSLTDVRCSNVSTGIYAAATGLMGAASLALTLDHVTIDVATTGIVFLGQSGASSLTATDCNFAHCSGTAANLSTFGTTNAAFDHCRLDQNGTAISVHNTNFGSTEVTLTRCFVVRNGAGFVGDAPGLGARAIAHFHSCTVADNTGAGAQALGSSPNYAGVSFVNTIVDGNGTNVNASNVIDNSYSSIGGPNPLFVDRANGDYRLAFGSPCLDTGDPAPPSIDGDLDTIERLDIGAVEFAPLVLTTSGHIGTPLRLEMWGPAGGTTTVEFSRLAPVAPMNTPFGQFDLDPAVHGHLFTSAVAPNPPIAFQRPIPPNPALIGRTFSFQALTSSSAAPLGFAWTNAVSVLIVP